MTYNELLKNLEIELSKVQNLLRAGYNHIIPIKVVGMSIQYTKDNYSHTNVNLVRDIFNNYSDYIYLAATELLPDIMKRAEELYQTDLKTHKEELEDLSIQLIKSHE